MLVRRGNSLHHNPWVVGSGPTAANPCNPIDKIPQKSHFDSLHTFYCFFEMVQKWLYELKLDSFLSQ